MKKKTKFGTGKPRDEDLHKDDPREDACDADKAEEKSDRPAARKPRSDHRGYLIEMTPGAPPRIFYAGPDGKKIDPDKEDPLDADGAERRDPEFLKKLNEAYSYLWACGCFDDEEEDWEEDWDEDEEDLDEDDDEAQETVIRAKPVQ